MPRILLLMCCGLAGCQTAGPFAILPDQFADFDLIVTSGQDAAVFDMNDPEDRQRWQTELLTQEISRTPRGSFVRIVDADDRQFLGTLIQASEDEVQLGNCLCKEVAPIRTGTGQLKLSHVEVQTFETTAITGFTMLSPPRTDFDPENPRQNRDDTVVQAIVMRSGRQVPWVDPREPAEFARSGNRDTMSDRIAAAMPGSQVSLIDEHGRRINGIVISTGPEEVELMNCLIREMISEADEPARHQTSHLPVQTFPASSLVSFAVVAPPPPDYAVPELGVDCEEYIVSEFVLESGRRLTWGKPENDENPNRSRFPLLSDFRNR